MSVKIPKLVVRGIDIKINNLEKVLDILPSKKAEVEKKFSRYEGRFLLFGNKLFRTPKLPFVNYLDLDFDAYDYGVLPKVIHGKFEGEKLHGHFGDGAILDFERKGYIGSANVQRYFEVEAFKEIYYGNREKVTRV